MAQININEKTFAFSTRSDTWTSRYSFDPTCYMTSGNKMLSSKDGLGVWLHDQLSARNKFYGNEVAKSSITVSANQDPSAIKMYKSLSIETNLKKDLDNPTHPLTAEVCTNVEYEGKEKQKGSIASFESKEGFQYAEMPRDVLNSTENIVGKPFTVSSLTEEYGFAEASAISSEFFDELEDFALNDAGITSFPVIAEEGFIPEDYVYSKALNVSLYNVQNSSLLKLFDVPQSVEYPQYNADPLALYVLGYKKYEGKVLLMLAYYFIAETFQNNIFFDETSSLYNNQLVFAVKPEIDGDQLRGPYVNVEISTQTDKHAEIHAINVDYEFSKLDKRLTQNT